MSARSFQWELRFVRVTILDGDARRHMRTISMFLMISVNVKDITETERGEDVFDNVNTQTCLIRRAYLLG